MKQRSCPNEISLPLFDALEKAPPRALRDIGVDIMRHSVLRRYRDPYIGFVRENSHRFTLSCSNTARGIFSRVAGVTGVDCVRSFDNQVASRTRGGKRE